MSEPTQALAQWDANQVALIRKAVSDPKNPLTQDEFALFIAVAKMTGLSPLEREIYALKVQGKMLIHVGIDGHRKMAAESGFYAGQVGPQWMGADGQWQDYWISDTPPAACRVGVLARGDAQPTWGVVTYRGFKVDSSPQWQKNPANQMAVRAEAQALRKRRFSPAMGMVHLAEDHDTPTTTSQVVASQHNALPEAQYHEQNESQNNQPGAVASSEAAPSGGVEPATGASGPPPAQEDDPIIEHRDSQPSAMDQARALKQAMVAIGMRPNTPGLKVGDSPETQETKCLAWLAEWQPQYDKALNDQGSASDTPPMAEDLR